MLPISPARNNQSAIRWRAVLCLVLGALFLYNPFLTIPAAGATYGTVHLHHPVSFRATVASCELGHYTAETAKTLLHALAVLPRELVQVAPLYTIGAVRSEALPLPLPQASCNSLWFRPPPFSLPPPFVL
jgi:hypothetical protein